MKTLVSLLSVAAVVCLFAPSANAQYVVYDPVVVSTPVTTYYTPSVSYYAATPVTTYYYSSAAPVTTYYSTSVPVTTYYAPAPTVAYYAPTVTYSPVVAPSTVYYTPAATVSTKVYYAGQPVRNFYRWLLP